jgi:hypothetical protein
MTRAWRDGLRFVAGGVAAFAAVYALSEALAPVYADAQGKVALFRERGAEVRAVSVGNSHSGAMDFAALDLPGMHFWNAGQDPFEAMFMARYAAERAPRLRYVLLTASYGFERLNNAAMTSADYTAIRRGAYLRTGVPRWIPGDRNLWIGARLAPVARTDQWSGVAARLAGLPRPAVGLAPDGTVLTPPPPRPSADSLAKYAPWQAGIHDARAAESLARDPATPARMAAGLEALARELRARGIVLVLYTPPYHHTYLRLVPPGVVEGTRRALQPALRHPNVVWLDFGTHPAFTRTDTLFKDSDHLNPDGARVFSALLRRCLDGLPAAGGRGGTMPDGCPGAAGPVASRGRTAGAPASAGAAAAPASFHPRDETPE